MKAHHLHRTHLGLIQRHPFAILMATLILVLAVSPLVAGDLAREVPWLAGVNALMPLSLLMVAGSLVALWRRKHRELTRFAAVLVVVLLLLNWFVAHKSLTSVQFSIQIIFLGWVMISVSQVVFRTRKVTGDILCGAVCVYLLLGIVAGLIFTVIENQAPGSFVVTAWENAPTETHRELIDSPGWLMYFAFTTLTTVGYGDVLPASALARSVSMMLAVGGQILMMVQIARLVGLHVMTEEES